MVGAEGVEADVVVVGSGPGGRPTAHRDDAVDAAGAVVPDPSAAVRARPGGGR
ncbi:hypothetical protein [Kineococcus sp. SYSU DK018]|uniref:hypothetical protein n=1 Tax=Kineococcus sp. SYSU DK018 TaxID=3383139 RepID=UPI003D7DCB66